MKDLYETRFGIFNHAEPSSKKNPLATVLHHPAEETLLNSALRDTIEEFAVYNLGELFNMSLTEYLQLPRPYVELIRSIKDDIIKKKDNVVSNIENVLKNASKHKK